MRMHIDARSARISPGQDFAHMQTADHIDYRVQYTPVTTSSERVLHIQNLCNQCRQSTRLAVIVIEHSP